MIDVNTLVQGDLLLMTCTAVPNELKKEAWIKEDTKLYHNVHIKEDYSILNPVFMLKSEDSIWKYNYVYFYNTKRFYFVDDIKALTGGCFELKCSVDVLMSFQKSIMNCMAFESRSSGIGTGYVADDKVIFNSAPVATVFEFEEYDKDEDGDGEADTSFNFNGISYILGVANDGKYYNLDTYGVNNTYNVSQNRNAANPGSVQGVFNRLMQAVYEGWVYSKEHREDSGYADCSSLIDKALLYNYPNIPFSTYNFGTMPSSWNLGHFLFYCATGADDTTFAPILNLAACSKTNIPDSFDKIPACSILFVANKDASVAETRWPATNSYATNALGIPKDLRAKSGYGHVMFYVGRMAYKPSDHTYYIWDDANHSGNPEYVDMGHNWIIHTTGDGANYTQWDETSLQPVSKREPGTAFICQMTSHSRLAGVFTPDYTNWNTKWGVSQG